VVDAAGHRLPVVFRAIKPGQFIRAPIIDERLFEIAHVIEVFAECIAQVHFAARRKRPPEDPLRLRQPRIAARHFSPAHEPGPGFRHVRLDADGAVQKVFGIREPAPVRLQLGELHDGSGQPRIDFERPPAAGLGFKSLVLQRQHAAKVAVRKREIRFDRERPPEARHGRIEISEILLHAPQVIVRLGIVGFDRERPPVAPGCLLELPRGPERIAQIALRLGVFRRQVGGPLQRRNSVLALHPKRQAQ